MKQNKKIRVGINGFGRIGSVALRTILMEKYDVEVAAINSVGDFDMEMYAMQFKYDSVFGRIPFQISWSDPQKSAEIGRLEVGELSIPFLSEADPRSGRSVDLVVEALHRARILSLGRDVAIDELDDRHLGGVRGADAGLDHAGVTTVAIGIARGQNVKQLHQLRIVEQTSVSQTAVRKTEIGRASCRERVYGLV